VKTQVTNKWGDEYSTVSCSEAAQRIIISKLATPINDSNDTGIDITKDVQIIISCIEELPYSYGKGNIIKLLMGTDNEKFNKISQYCGVLKSRDELEITEILNSLISKGYLRNEKNQNGFMVISLTEKSKLISENKVRFLK
jgi:ATP-dependent DNA helicase RecQ